jgi:hypothetical protein
LLPRAALAVAVLALAGCANLSPAMRSEIAWQAMNAVDTGQTVTIARQPAAFHEADPLTSRIVGEHPREGSVYGVMLGYAVLHAGVSLWLDRMDPGAGGWHKANIAWHAISIGSKGAVVVHNFAIGLTPWEGAR